MVFDNNILTTLLIVFSISITLYLVSILFGFITRNINRKAQGLDK